MKGDNIQRESPNFFMRTLIQIMPRLTPVHVWMYKAVDGRLVNRATLAAPVLLLTTTGRHSGQPRTVAVGYMQQDRNVIIAGSNGGLSKLPGWIYNLRANPQAVVQIGKERYPAIAEFLEGDEWHMYWDQLIETYPSYDDARRWSGRSIPLVRLVRYDSRTE